MPATKSKDRIEKKDHHEGTNDTKQSHEEDHAIALKALCLFACSGS